MFPPQALSTEIAHAPLGHTVIGEQHAPWRQTSPPVQLLSHCSMPPQPSERAPQALGVAAHVVGVEVGDEDVRDVLGGDAQ